MSLPTVAQFRSAFPELSAASDLTVQHALDAQSLVSEWSWGSGYTSMVLNSAAVLVARQMVKSTAKYQGTLDDLLTNRAQLGEPVDIADVIVNLDADVTAEQLRLLGPTSTWAPTADRTIDIPTGLSQSCRIEILKMTGSLFGLFVSVASDPTWTTPMGRGLGFWLTGSRNNIPGSWTLVINWATKVISEVVAGVPNFMCSAPVTTSPTTLDLFTAGTYTGNAGLGTHLTGAPTADGSAFMTADTNNVRIVENYGGGQRLLLEPTSTNLCLQSETMSAAGSLTSPWVARGAPTFASTVAGDPRGNAKVTRIIATGAYQGLEQPVTISADSAGCIAVWARAKIGDGTSKCAAWCRLRDGATYINGPDINLTETWKRVYFGVSNVGPQGSATQPRFGIGNASDGVARNIEVVMCNIEARMSPTSYMPTVGATVTRTAGSILFTPGQWPTLFRTAGVKLGLWPSQTAYEAFLSANAWVTTLCSWDDNLSAGNIDTLSFQAHLFAGTGGSGAISTSVLNDTRLARSTTLDPITWLPTFVGSGVDGSHIIVESQAYRGVIKVSGAVMGNGEMNTGSGPWRYGTGPRTPDQGSMGFALSVGSTASQGQPMSVDQYISTP